MKKILIVDDEPNIVMTLEYLFRKNKYEVFIARDGAEALEIAVEHVPDVILLDIMMPNVDGFQVLKEIKMMDDLKETKVVFLSAKNKVADVALGLKLGAEKYLAKPFSTKKLLKEINELFET